MSGIRDRMLVAHVERRSKAQTARQRHRFIGQNVAEHIGDQDHVVALRARIDVGSHCVDVHFTKRDVFVLLSEFVGFAHEETVGHLQHVLLANCAYVLAAARCVFECHLGDATRTFARDFAYRQRDVFGRHEIRYAHVHIAIGVKTFGVFARYQHVEAGPRIRHARARARGAQVGVKL